VTQYDTEIDKCQGNDWICLCNGYTNKLTCYNNCVGSDERPPVQNQVTQYCNAAAPLLSSSLAAAATQAKATTSAPAASTTGDTSATGSNTATSSIASASGFSTNAAAPVRLPVGGVFAVLLGVAGML